MAVGITGASLSQADASQSSSTASCNGSGGLLSAATSALCAVTTSAGSLLGSVTGGATSGVTGTVTSVAQTATGAVGSVTGTHQSSSAGGTSSGSGTGSTGGTGGTGSAGPGSGTTAVPPAASGATAAGKTTHAARPGGALLTASRAIQVKDLSRRLGLSAIPVSTTAQAKTVRLGASQPTATRLIGPARPSLAVSLWLLVAAIGGLAGAVGLIYASWRNADLMRRRRRAARRRTGLYA